MDRMNYEKRIQKALDHAERVKLNQELKELRHSNDKPKEKITFSKGVFIFMIANCIVIEVYSLVAMFFFGDLSSLSALIAAVVGECITTIGYYVKAGKENTKDGIVYETAMKKLEYELENNSDEAVG